MGWQCWISYETMHFKFLCLILLVMILDVSSGLPQRVSRQTSCQVKELETDRQKPCQFPFIWRGVKNYGCTTVDGGGIPWCSTKIVPTTLEHDISGEYYGNCDENVDDCYRTDDKCDTDWTWTIWEKGEERKDGYFTLAVYQARNDQSPR